MGFIVHYRITTSIKSILNGDGTSTNKSNKVRQVLNVKELYQHLPFLHSQHLVSIFLPQLGVNALVDAHRVHGESNCQQAVHLLILLVNLKKKKKTLYKCNDICFN